MFVDSDLKINKPELTINIDRQKAALMGVSIQEVARALQLSFSGQRYGYFLQNDRQYEVIGQVERKARNEAIEEATAEKATKEAQADAKAVEGLQGAKAARLAAAALFDAAPVSQGRGSEGEKKAWGDNRGMEFGCRYGIIIIAPDLWL